MDELIDRISSENPKREINDDEVQLQWAAIERLPTYKRLRWSLLDQYNESTGSEGEVRGKRAVDVAKLGASEQHLLIENLIKNVEEDNRRLLEKQRERIKNVEVKLPTVEVRYKNLSVEEKCEVVDGKPLPTLWNTVKGASKELLKIIRIKSREANIKILKDVSGVIKPSRMTLLLGPPGCGKTTLLLTLAGKFSQTRKVTGEISYNGFTLEEFVPEKTAAYISQYDKHIPEMTVRETLDFSARCQGVGSRIGILQDVIRREKQAGITPDFDIDTYMKAISVERLHRNLQTDYILKILGLEICSDTQVGDAMNRAISGGQKKRLTTGEMIVGPTRVLFMDEISNGLDSSTTFQIISCLQQLVHITEVTALVSLLQPAPEIFDLFDDITLMAEGKIIYHGPRVLVLDFFEKCGFRCPQRKDIAEFLQEVISKKDQAQFWYKTDMPHSFVSPDSFFEKFKASDIGKKLEDELSEPYDRSLSHRNALANNIYSLTRWELFKTCMARELLLMKRNSFVHVFTTAKLVIISLITMTAFLRTHTDLSLVQAAYYMGALDYTLIRLMTNGNAELTLSISRQAIFYKQRDFHFYPAWAYTIPGSILKVPVSLVESFIWTVLTYYAIGYSPEAERFVCHFLILFALHQAATSLFRFLASISRTQAVAALLGSWANLIFFLFGGFIHPRTSFPAWLEWGFWLSPVTYAEIGISINEFLAPRWQKVSSENTTIGHKVLRTRGLDFEDYFYWISLGALFGFTLLFNIGITLALTYLNNLGTSRAIISRRQLSLLRECSNSNGEIECGSTKVPFPTVAETKGRMAIPFKPLTITFQDVQYFIDTPQEIKKQGFTKKRLQLLQNITGAFRPGVLAALMGVSGAGKTTLMDVLCGRKTGGIIGGDIRIGGYPKCQETFSRISGYCEQNDIHSSQITVEESVIYSAWLRLPPQINPQTKAEFVKEVLEMIELDTIKDALVGSPGIDGLSTEQRKRLTIAVELVANPSIIFMDEPTSGLDARAAAIVMRVVKNIVQTGRTIVCTIHQPSINIFESFDELFLMKRGGQTIYSGPLGQNSHKLIEYFEGISGVKKIKDNYNPATWMLEVTSTAAERKLCVDFAHIYQESSLYQENKRLVEQLTVPPVGSSDLHFLTRYPQNAWGQFKACLWKQCLSYWRSPIYNLVRIIFVITSSALFGALYWQQGQKIHNERDLFNILGSMYLATITLGINNCSTVIPIIARERTVLYRERFAGMYSPWTYAMAQVIIEIPCMFLLAATFVTITYPTIGYCWTAYKVLWYLYTNFCTLLYYNYLGMLVMSLSPTTQVAAASTSACYTMLSLFSGYMMPAPRVPRWWIWLYWICPTSWTLRGMLTSQYGDSARVITAFGEHKLVDTFIGDYYGFRHNQLGLVALILICFPLAFGSLFVCCIGKLNFQHR